jgi:hypothetical protein
MKDYSQEIGQTAIERRCFKRYDSLPVLHVLNFMFKFMIIFTKLKQVNATMLSQPDYVHTANVFKNAILTKYYTQYIEL